MPTKRKKPAKKAMREIGTVPVAVYPDMPPGSWDLKVSRTEKWIEWVAPGAVMLEIEFKPPMLPLRLARPWRPDFKMPQTAKGRLVARGTPPVCRFRIPKRTKKNDWNYVAYTIIVTYANGGVFMIDPVLIIQP